ncbi:MAG TPA: cytochrome d ubiquinol oxidase subunit II [Candidatus Polarisedimenticolaceae bacterium]|nr:cytochrome d ubiquinol oxidase subunit II [Candidatus Polarisedimenticolaceae bacterium]
MIEIWFAIVALMLTAYVVLDGFDLGAGALHFVAGRDGEERGRILAAIGPYWDGNEVCLLVAGGTLLVAFPKALAAGLSGFYFAIFLVLWTLILRGISIEFRNHVAAPLWRSFWDVVFSAASAALAVLLGAALGNLVRGVPIDERGWFSLALFTDWTARNPVGILDWYTVATGLFALVALTTHGAAFLAWKCDGELQSRARRVATRGFPVVAVAWVLVTAATRLASPDFFAPLRSRPVAWLGGVLAMVGLTIAAVASRRARDTRAFLGSCAFLVGLMAATAALFYPDVLRSSIDPSQSLTVMSAANDRPGLAIALTWWCVGASLAVGYFVLVFRLHAKRGQLPKL